MEPRISTFGDFLARVFTQPNLHMMHFLRAPSASLPMSAFGNLGHPLSAVSLCGWLLTTIAGQQTGLLGEASPIQTDVCCAIKRRTFNTYMCLQDNSSLNSYRLLDLQLLLHNLMLLPLMTGGTRQL